MPNKTLRTPDKKQASEMALFQKPKEIVKNVNLSRIKGDISFMRKKQKNKKK